MNTVAIADVINLSVSERIQIAEDIWDSIIEVPDAISLTEADKQELNQRLYAYHQDPSEGSPWGAVFHVKRNPKRWRERI